MGLFIAPATSADYEVKPFEITCVPHKAFERASNKVKILGATELSSEEKEFGGLSGLIMRRDTSTIYTMTDRARLIKTTPIFDKNNVVTCMQDTIMRPLRGRSTRPLIGHYGDSEGLSFANKNENKILVSFERAHRIVEYALEEKQLLPKHHYKEFELKELPYNDSYESVRRLENGDIIGFPENFSEEKNILQGYLVTKKKQRKKIYLKQKDTYVLTDINILSNGDFITLERAFSFFKGINIIMRHIPQKDLLSGKVADGKIIFEISSGEGGDNMEGMSVIPTKGGDLLYVVSDDNFTSLQDTIIFSLFYRHE